MVYEVRNVTKGVTTSALIDLKEEYRIGGNDIQVEHDEDSYFMFSRIYMIENMKSEVPILHARHCSKVMKCKPLSPVLIQEKGDIGCGTKIFRPHVADFLATE